MSGGSYNYMYSRVREEYVGYMYDEEMNDLIKDLCDVFHDVEWWQSSDIGEEDYRETVRKFKDKWFKQTREERLQKYIDEKLDKIRKEMYQLIGTDYIPKLDDIGNKSGLAIKINKEEK